MYVMKPILSLCIPTYNRANDLNHNLSLVESFFKEDQELKENVVILISDNHSSDNTAEVVKTFMKSDAFSVQYFCQKTNIGGGNNTVWLVEKAKTQWVMTLGDDDYLEPWYISDCLHQIETHPNLGCIIPNSIAYNPLINEYGKTREDVNDNILFWNAGFQACLNNAHYGHSLSGLCFRRDSLSEQVQKHKLDNLYPQIFFVAYNALRYDVLHYRKVCLQISDVPQSHKDWRYGDDGLINDVFENYKKLGVSCKQRAQLEAHFLETDPRYYWATNNRNLCIEKILTGNNVSYLGRYYIAKQIIRGNCYTGKKLRIPLSLLATYLIGIRRFRNILKKVTCRTKK